VAVDRSHEDIELPDGAAVSVGRSASTNIADTQVSRLHGNNSNNNNNDSVCCALIGPVIQRENDNCITCKTRQ